MSGGRARSALARLALFLALAAAMWWSSLWLYDTHNTRDATGWRQAVLNGESPYRWDFETRRDVSSGHGIEVFDWSGGGLSGDLDDPYIYLNLRGRLVDARRYSRLRIELDAGSDSYLQLFHHQGREEVIHFSPPVAIRAGPQTVELDLYRLRWQSRNVHLTGDEARPSAWGSPNGLVTALRIDPVLNGAFRIDSAELLDTTGQAPADPDLVRFRNLKDPALQPMAGTPGALRFLAHDRWLRTPETAHRTRMAVAKRYPSAILFPKPADTGSNPVVRLAPGVAPGILFAAAVLAFLLRNRTPEHWRGAVQLLAYLAMAIGFLFLEPRLAGWLKLLPLLPLAAATWLLRPGKGQGVPGIDHRAWLYLSPVIVVSLALLVLLYRQSPEEGPLWQTLVIYLGWALIQQYVIAVVVFGRLRGLCPDHAVVLAAGVFGFLHLPNFALMCGTFLLGVLLLRVYRCHPNLPALAVTHALAAVGANLATPGWLWLSREVGPRFLDAL